ncbi:MAG: hypothetical protein WEB00_10365 [Dehalococcoidia bacterium]
MLGLPFLVPRPEESHRIFGAFFLTFGALLVVEALAGGVWHRNRLRTMLWPVGVLFLGSGMFMVAVMDPDDRLVHATVGSLLMFAGYIEGRHRLYQLPRSTADLFIVPALLAAALEMGVIHARGEDIVVASHITLGLTGLVLASARIYQSFSPQSLARASGVALVVMLVGAQLLLHPGASAG